MEQYIVSARKYRPDSFESLIGQDNIARTLKNSILRNQLAHAYLFCGPRGVGKTSAARIFAKTINCENLSEEAEPCGHCESCVSFQEGRSYCIHELDAASNNGVDDIKALMDQVQIPPQVGRYSVYIIDEVHMLSTAAFNAFLKTLEEPPAHAIFILATTEKHKILPTILSRCQTYDFNRISVPDIVRNLRGIAAAEKITIDDESLHVIARKADGAMRDALTIFDQTVAFCGTDIKYGDVLQNLGVLDYEYCFNLVDNFLSGDYPSALLRFDEILSKGFNALHFVGALSSHLRDLLVAGSGGLDSILELPDTLKAKYREQASRCPLKFLYDALAVTSACESGYRASTNPRLHIEFALMRLCALAGQGVPAAPSASVFPAAAKTAAAPQAAPAVAPAAQAAPARPAARPEPSPAPQPEKPARDNGPAEPAAAAPAPAAAAPAPKARKRPAKTGASLSISSIAEEGASTKVEDDRNGGDEMPSDEAVKAAWEKLPAMYPDRPRLSGTLSTSKISIAENEGYKSLTFYVINQVQQQWIQERLLRELESKMCLALGTGKLRLLVEVTPDEAVEAAPYTPKEKAEALMSGNPEIQKLVTDFGLDI